MISAVFDSELVCCADTLINLALTPYEKDKGWKITLIRYHDAIFINQCQEKIEERMDKREYYREKKFAHYLTKDKTDEVC